jgi:redox-sensitive bicupin YhaK (pirin superfamily)
MTAGSGLLHKEYHEEEFSKKGGIFQMVQLWVNLPAKYKKISPKYQEITNTKMGRHDLPGDKGLVEVIAGEYNNVKGPASTFTPIEMYNARIKKDAEATFNFPSNYNTGLLVIEGNVQVNDINAVVEK